LQCGCSIKSRELGVERAYDYRTTDFSKLGGRFDVVYDTAATLPTAVGLSRLSKNGVFLDIDPTPAKFLRSFVNRKFKPIVCSSRAEILDRVARGKRRQSADYGRRDCGAGRRHPTAWRNRSGQKDWRKRPDRDGVRVSRSHRLFELMQVLRRRRGTVSGEVLARETNVSLRTIRRDIATLQGMGAHIDGEAGVGYILRQGFLLPPMSFTEEEIHALVAGAQWVSRQTDQALALAAQNALAKIGGIIPTERRPALDDDTFYVSSGEDVPGVDLG
jgi:biotin operon repressor